MIRIEYHVSSVCIEGQDLYNVIKVWIDTNKRMPIDMRVIDTFDDEIEASEAAHIWNSMRHRRESEMGVYDNE